MKSPQKMKKAGGGQGGGMLSAKLYKASVKESSKDNSYDPNQMIIGNKTGAQSIT